MTSKRPENILLKRPPVSRVSSNLEGFSELTSDSLVRGKNPSNAMVSEGSLSFCFCCYLSLVWSGFLLWSQPVLHLEHVGGIY